MGLTPSGMLSMAAIVIVSLAIAWQSIALLCLRFAQRTNNSAIYRVLAVCAPTRIRRIAASTIALSTLGISTSVADDTYTQTVGGETMNQTPDSLRAPAWITPEIQADMTNEDSPRITAMSTHTTDLRVTVAPGDTLWSIVHAHFPHVPAEQLPDLVLDVWQYNRTIIGNDANLILPGQELLIPHS